MKFFYPILLACMAASIPASAETLTLFGETTGKSNLLPVYVYYTSNEVRSQMIYPASMLTSIKGKVIDKVSFTLIQAGTLWKSPKITLRMGTTEQTEYTEATYIEKGLTEVGTVAVEGLSSTTEVPYTWEITLSKPFIYTGDNLLLDFTNEKGTGNGRTWNFAAEAQTTATGLSKGGSVQLVKALPKIAIEYSDAQQSSAAVSESDVTFPLTFIGEKSQATIKLTNTGTETLSGTVTVEGDGFTSTLANVEALAAEESKDITLQFAPETAGDCKGKLTIALTGIDPITVNLAGMAVDGPEPVRTVFNGRDYELYVPAGWNAYAEEYLTEGGEFSAGSTEYNDFGTTLRFESETINGQDALLWNHANPMPYSDIYTRYYYLVSPMAGGRMVLGATLNDVAATGAFVKAFAANYNESTHLFEIGDEIVLTWDNPLAQGTWSIGEGTAPGGVQIALLLKYAAVNFFAADNQTGIAAVGADDENAPVEYYNLQGVRMKGQLAPGLYIRLKGKTADKVIVK